MRNQNNDDDDGNFAARHTDNHYQDIQNQNGDDGGDFAGVPDPVTIVSGSAGVNAYSYLLRWTVPMTGGAEITNYKVEYAVVSRRNDMLLS